MQGLVDGCKMHGMPLQKLNRTIAEAATKLCEDWVCHHYAMYHGDHDQRRHDSSSLMNMLKNDVLLHFSPVIGSFAELLQSDHNRKVVSTDDRKSFGYRKSMSPGGTILFDRIESGVKKADLRWQEFAMLYLGNIRSQQAWEILHMEDVAVKNHL